MHLNPYGEYAVLLAASLANDWPEDRAGIVDRAESYGMQTPFANPQADDYTGVRRVIDRWLEVVDEPLPQRRADLLNQHLQHLLHNRRLKLILKQKLGRQGMIGLDRMRL